MLSIIEIVKLGFRLIGFRYSLLILLAISLTSALLLFSDGVLQGYEKSLLVKVIGSTPHVSVLLNEQVDDAALNEIKNSLDMITPIKFSARGLAYSGTADIFTVGFADSTTASGSEEWKQEEIKSQSPEIFFKGMLNTPEYANYLDKVLLKFKSAQEEDSSAVSDIYTYKDPKDWDEALVYRKPIAFPPSLYREIIDPYISQANYPFIRFTQSEKLSGLGSKLKGQATEFVVVAGLDTPVSDDTVPIVSAYETMEYVLKGTTKNNNTYNYLELFFDDPMESKSISNKLQEIFLDRAVVSAWSDRFKSEVALVNIFNFLFLSVMIGTGISIGLLLSSLLDITVRRKRRQISVLMAIGSQGSLIAKLFIYYSLAIALLSFFVSLIVASLANLALLKFVNLNDEDFEGLSKIKLLHQKLQGIPEPDGMSITIVLVMLASILLISFFSSYHSALEASNTNPIEGLKEN